MVRGHRAGECCCRGSQRPIAEDTRDSLASVRIAGPASGTPCRPSYLATYFECSTAGVVCEADLYVQVESMSAPQEGE